MEAYAEDLCDKLFINDTYYGNLLMCLNDLNEVLVSWAIEEKIELSYNTDFSILNIVAKGAEKESNKHFKTDNLSDDSNSLSLIRTLSDDLLISDNTIEMQFNIGALHKSIYEERLKHLKTYLNKLIKVRKAND